MMPNNNVLITEGVSGRVFEVTRQKEIVWEFLNPARSGEHGELIASIFDLLRIPKEYVAPWLE
ncbi:MAG TPA: hypothetical protein ENN29_04960 [Candidatus Hydrogenedentes bacterium]|nr:hypothetical protein [Candidatus Hydrogenedentota bacterium]